MRIISGKIAILMVIAKLKAYGSLTGIWIAVSCQTSRLIIIRGVFGIMPLTTSVFPDPEMAVFVVMWWSYQRLYALSSEGSFSLTLHALFSFRLIIIFVHLNISCFVCENQNWWTNLTETACFILFFLTWRIWVVV